MFELLIESELVWRLGWTLLHSLWEILLVGAVVFLALALMSRQSAKVRYWTACCGLASFYIPLIATFIHAPQQPVDKSAERTQTADVIIRVDELKEPVIVTDVQVPNEDVIPIIKRTNKTEAAIEADIQGSVVAPGPSTDSVSVWLPWIVSAWGTVVVLLSVTHVGGWLYTIRLRRLATSPATVAAVERFRELTLQMRIPKTVRLLESMQIDVPITFGWLKPVVLMPPSLLTGLSPDELDAVLAHELADIRRCDYLVNLIQTFSETLLFFHPVVWMLSRRIRIEREYCCDDEAVEMCGSKTEYARALATVEACRTPQLAMSFLGRSKNMTLDRVRRLMGASSTSPPWLHGSLASLVLVASLAFALLLPNETEADSQEVQKPAKGDSQFRLDIQFEGDSDKPFYSFSLMNFPTQQEANKFHRFQEVDADDEVIERAKAWLRTSNFYEHAKQGEVDSTDLKQRYLLRVREGGKAYVEDINWDLGTLLRMKALQSALRGNEKKARTELDPLLSRLSGFRKLWTQSKPKNDLKTQLTAKRKSFVSDDSIRVVLSVQNVGEEDRPLATIFAGNGVNERAYSHFSFKIFDQYGRRVPYVGGYAQFMESRRILPAGELDTFAFDLAISHYLRRPGTYTVVHDAFDLPRSNAFTFEVKSGDDKDGDIAGKLLPLLRDQWYLITNPIHQGKVQPGVKFTEVDGFPARFHHQHPGGSIADIGVAQFWFTSSAAKPFPVDVEPAPTPSQYIGKAGRWHMYASVDERAMKAWPTILTDVRNAVAEKSILEEVDDSPRLKVSANLSSGNKYWSLGEVPIFSVDVINNGSETFILSPRQQVHEIEINGNWYIWAGAIRVLSGYFPPKAKMGNIEFNIDPKFWRLKGADVGFQPKPSLKEGQNTIRVAMRLTDSEDTNKRWRVLSNRINFEMRKPTPTQTTDADDPPNQIPEAAPPKMHQDGNIRWRYHGKNKHVWVSRATDATLEKLSTQNDITYLSLSNDDSRGGIEIGEGQSRRGGITDNGLRHIAKLKNLETLIMPDTGITDRGLRHLQDMHSLRELWLDFLPLTDDGVAYLKDLKKLRVLRFFQGKITDVGMQYIRDMTDLEDLQLGRAEITDKSMPIIGNMTKLKTLDLRVNVTDKGLEQLKKLKDLNWLCLNQTKVTDAGMQNLAELTKLEWLMLEDTPVTAKGLAKLSALPSVTTLYLSGTNINDEAISQIVKLPKLERLKVNQTLTTDRGLTRLAQIQSLKEVEVRRTLVTLYGVRQITDLRPKLKVIADVKPAPKNLISNGGFETPSKRGFPYMPVSIGKLGGWTVARGSVDIVTSYWQASSGKQSLDMTGLQNTPGTIYQNVETSEGRTYTVRFAAAANPEPADVATPKVLHVYWNGRKIAGLTLSAKGRSFTNVGWQFYEFEVTGKEDTSRLQFQSLTTSPCGPIIDDVSVTPLVNN